MKSASPASAGGFFTTAPPGAPPLPLQITLMFYGFTAEFLAVC